MSGDIIQKCCICEADFRPGTLDKNGKCSSCQKAFPTVKNKAEAMALNRPEIHLNKKLDAEDVRQIVKEELNAFKAEQTDKITKQLDKKFGALCFAECDKEGRPVAGKADNMAKARAAKQDKKDDDKGDE